MDPNQNSRHMNPQFPSTHWSLILDGKRRQECLTELAKEYWTPIYLFARRSGCSRDEAQDFTQNLFIRIHEGKLLEKADRDKKFRSFLIGTLKNLFKEEYKKNNAQKRGGGKALLSLDVPFGDEEEQNYLEPSYTPEDVFNKEWARLIVEQALSCLKEHYEKGGKEDRQLAFQAFHLHWSEEMAPAEIAEKLGKSASWVSEKIYRAKQKYGEFLQAIVRDTMEEGESVEKEIYELMEYYEE